MSKFTLRKQPNLHDERQIFSPEELEEGVHIGNVMVFDRTRIPLRAARAAAAFTIGYGRGENQSRTNAAREAWCFRDLEGPVPSWRGVVSWINREGGYLGVDLLADRGEDAGIADLADLAEGGFDALHEVNRPTELRTSFASLGLVAIEADPYTYRPGTLDEMSDVDRWQPYATLRLEDQIPTDGPA